MLRFPDGQAIGPVGEIRIDGRSGNIIGSTPSREAVAKARQLSEETFGARSASLVQPEEK